jgi:hypothetical protein
MAGELWRTVWQVGLESTYGVAAAATRIVYLNGEPVLNKTFDTRIHEAATGTRAQARSASRGPAQIATSVTFPLSASEALEWLLVTLQGGLSPTTPTGATNGRLWSFVGGTTALDSMTAEYNDGATAYRGYGIYGNSFTINFAANGEASITFELMGLDRESNALATGLSARVPTITEGWETIVSLDAAGSAGIAQQDAFLLEGSVTYTNNLVPKFYAANRNRVRRFVQGKIGVTASLKIEAASAQAAAELANWDAVTRRTIQLRHGFNRSTNPISGDTPANNVKTGTISGGPASGDIELVVLGVTTAAVAYNATGAQVASAIQTALQAAFGSDYTCSGTGSAGGPWVITFTGALAGRNLPPITNGTSTFDAGTVGWVETTPGYAAAEGATITVPGVWTAADIGQTDQGTRAYQMSMGYIYDPVLGYPMAMTLLNGRSAAW